MWVKTVSHSDLMPARQWFDQWIDLRCSCLPRVRNMGAMGLLASIELAWVHLAQLLFNSANSDVVVIDYHGRRRASTLVRSALRINVLVSQEQMLPLGWSQILRRLRSLSVGFKRPKLSLSGGRGRGGLLGWWRRAANKALFVGLGFRCAWG